MSSGLHAIWRLDWEGSAFKLTLVVGRIYFFMAEGSEILFCP